MKKLIYLLFFVISSLQIGCKKDNSNKISSQGNVNYSFNTNGEPSKITYTSVQEGKTITLTNITTTPGPSNIYPPYKVLDHVKVGDRVKLEMSCSKNIVNYGIYISHIKDLGNGVTNSLTIAASSNIILESGLYKVILEHTFTKSDFSN